MNERNAEEPASEIIRMTWNIARGKAKCKNPALRLRALALLGKHYGCWKETTECEGGQDVEVVWGGEQKIVPWEKDSRKGKKDAE